MEKEDSTFIETMRGLAKSDNKQDKDLVEVIKTNEALTQAELDRGAADNEKCKQYMILQSTIANQAERYLSDSTTTLEKFKAAIKHPSSTGFQRVLTTMTRGLYKGPQLTPEKLGNIILDLYNAQTKHKGAVHGSLGILRNKRGLMFDIAKEAAEDIKDNSLSYKIVQAKLNKLDWLYTIMDKILRDEDYSKKDFRNQLALCHDAGLFACLELIQRIDGGDDVKPDLYVVKTDLQRTMADFKDTYLESGLRVKGANTMMQGMDLQIQQFEETIKGMSAQHMELDVDIHYTKHLAYNTFHLLQAQGISDRAMDAYFTYKDVMNDVQIFNSLGTRVMLDRVGFVLVNPFFEPETLEKAKDELTEAVTLYAHNERIFHENVQDMIQKLGLGEVEKPAGLLKEQYHER